ncbi:MAG: TetR family transcriptional regulator [Thermaurantiacus sp.]
MRVMQKGRAPIKRARADWQKEARERQILDSAVELFASNGRLPAMAEVAERAGLAKGTLYLYFRGREALWLELLNGCFDRWVEAIEVQVRTGRDVPDAIIAGAEADPVLIPLSICNATLIEPNAGPADALRFKDSTAAHIMRLARFLAPRIGIAEDEARRLVILTYAMLLGLWQMATPTPPVRDAADRARAPGFWTLDWQADARAGLRALWSARAPHG